MYVRTYVCMYVSIYVRTYVIHSLRYSYALFEAVDHCSDGIEITTPESDGKIVVSQ